MVNEWIKKSIRHDTHTRLFLEMRDANGVEYRDGDILKVQRDGREILGFVRYFGGRFEIVCPFQDQRFVYGLNTTHTIVGNMADSVESIENQERTVYAVAK